jgi:hypothetical protein
MAVTMHVKSDSEVTSVDHGSSPPRSPRRLVYFVQSPSNHDVEKMSYGSSPMGSPHHYYHCSPIHHSRESSTSRFSASLKNTRNHSAWKKIQKEPESDDDDDEDDDGVGTFGGLGRNLRLYICFVFLFVVLFSVFSLILWSASKGYKPKVFVKVLSLSLLREDRVEYVHDSVQKLPPSRRRLSSSRCLPGKLGII